MAEDLALNVVVFLPPGGGFEPQPSDPRDDCVVPWLIGSLPESSLGRDSLRGWPCDREGASLVLPAGTSLLPNLQT